jgi:hypothetical protein
VTLSGDLRGVCNQKSKISARVVGSFVDEEVDFDIAFWPGKGEEFAKGVIEKLKEK